MEGRPQLNPSDREQLQGFVLSLYILLSQLLSRRPSLFTDESLTLLRAAWNELVEEGRFENLLEAVTAGEYDRGLVDHGLYGRQLAMKVGIYESLAEPAREDETRALRRPVKRRKLLGAALKAANVVLGSAADVIPGGAVVKEFKDGTEAALDERLPFRRRIVTFLRRPKVEQPEEWPEPPELVGTA